VTNIVMHIRMLITSTDSIHIDRLSLSWLIATWTKITKLKAKTNKQIVKKPNRG